MTEPVKAEVRYCLVFDLSCFLPVTVGLMSH